MSDRKIEWWESAAGQMLGIDPAYLPSPLFLKMQNVEALLEAVGCSLRSRQTLASVVEQWVSSSDQLGIMELKRLQKEHPYAN